MAGEIFIAKEATSQDIKTIVDANGNALSSLSTNLATANANINTINSNVNALANSVKRPNGKNYKFFYDQNAVNSSLTDVVSISGSGFLKSAFIINLSTSNTYAQIKITIDGIVLLNLNSTSKSLNNGFAIGVSDTYEAGAGNSGYYNLPIFTNGFNIETSLYTVRSYVFNSPTEQATIDSYGALFIIPELLRFNNSLKLSIKRGSANMLTICEYYLD